MEKESTIELNVQSPEFHMRDTNLFQGNPIAAAYFSFQLQFHAEKNELSNHFPISSDSQFTEVNLTHFLHKILPFCPFVSFI